MLARAPSSPVRLWRSLCFACEPRSTVFFARLCVSLLVLGFCMYKLIQTEDCATSQYYSGTLTFLLGTWVAPVMHRDAAEAPQSAAGP